MFQEQNKFKKAAPKHLQRSNENIEEQKKSGFLVLAKENTFQTQAIRDAFYEMRDLRARMNAATAVAKRNLVQSPVAA